MDLKEEKIYIRGIGLNYLKTGRGEHPVLLLPGAMGSIWTDFKPQIENLDTQRFTIVAWDPPGYGKSIPPNRNLSDGFLYRDATFANDLMKALGYKTFSMIGWCQGGITALLLAAMYPDSIRKIIVIGTNSYILPEELTAYKGLRDIDGKIVRTPLADIYGDEYVRSLRSAWIDAMVDLYENRGGNLCMDVLGKINCPTLIVHGKGDSLTKESHATVLKEKIRNSSVRIFENGRHNPHLRFSKEFNHLATDFLSKF